MTYVEYIYYSSSLFLIALDGVFYWLCVPALLDILVKYSFTY